MDCAVDFLLPAESVPVSSSIASFVLEPVADLAPFAAFAPFDPCERSELFPVPDFIRFDFELPFVNSPESSDSAVPP